jgi:hypothetical protein
MAIAARHFGARHHGGGPRRVDRQPEPFALAVAVNAGGRRWRINAAGVAAHVTRRITCQPIPFSRSEHDRRDSASAAACNTAQATATHAINRLAAVVAEAPTKANNARGDTRRMRDARRWGTNVGTLA